MKYLPNQKPAIVRLDYDRVLLLLKALHDYVPRLTQAAPDKLRRLRAFARSLPRSLPYEVRIHALEWEILSPALRPNGSSPEAGTEAARMYALYTLLRPKCRFLTERMLAEEQKIMAAHRQRRLRGEFDRELDPSAPRIPRRRG